MSAEFWMNLQMIYDLRNAKALPAKVKKSIEENSSVRARDGMSARACRDVASRCARSPRQSRRSL
jgi:hypothetical protein